MSKDNSYPYLNNVLFCLKEGTPWLIKFYKTHSPEARSKAFINGGYTDILFSHIEEGNLLPHVNLKPFYEINEKVDSYVYDGDECKSEDEVLRHVNEILDLWAELHEKTSKLLLSELKDHLEVLKNLKCDELFGYCFDLLPYGNNYDKKFIDHFIQEVVNKQIK